ncbi:MAG: hypoxanthine phosphoribosyltransferase [Actinomycetota bacterium]
MEGPVSILYTRPEIQERVRELGAEITRDYAEREPILITVLKGGMVFLADLFRALEVRAAVDFMSISSYDESRTASGVVRIEKDLEQDIGGADVILVEDIVDTGLTLSYLLSTLEQRGPASLEVCALLDKAVRRIAPLDIRYRGFECPDRFVVGYGLDLAQRYRNLPFILAVDDVETASDRPDLLLPALTGDDWE